MSSPQLRSDKNYQEKLIAGGNFGAVFNNTINEDGREYALKKII